MGGLTRASDTAEQVERDGAGTSSPSSGGARRCRVPLTEAGKRLAERYQIHSAQAPRGTRVLSHLLPDCHDAGHSKGGVKRAGTPAFPIGIQIGPAMAGALWARGELQERERAPQHSRRADYRPLAGD